MRITVRLDPARLQKWHTWLLEMLDARGLGPVTVRFEPPARAAPAVPRALSLLMALERATGRAPAHDALAPALPDERAFNRPDPDGAAPSLLIDVCGMCGQVDRALVGPRSPPTLRLVFDDAPDESGLWLALLDRRAPLISVSFGDGSPPKPLALPALENPLNLSSSASMVLSRAAEALAIATAEMVGVTRIRPGIPVRPRPLTGAAASASGFVRAVLDGKARAALDRQLKAAPRWAVASRPAPDGRTHPPIGLDPAALAVLPDDGQRYYADPFLIAHDGRLHLFVEEYPYATGRGIVSHATLGSDGRFTPPRPVLERPYHLSYPQVFRHGGELWMLPETSAAGAIELYRAVAFPYRWERVAALVDGSFHDATFFEHGGRLWISAGSVATGSATWDGLSLFHADHLLGPWHPHPANPVLVDARSARPAGALYRHGDDLWRPAQDCTTGYGGALTLARVTRLDPETFDQDVAGTLHLAPTTGRREPRATGVLGPHTINHCGSIEVIDLFAPAAWRADRRST